MKADALAGGSSPEILVGKSSGSFVVTGIPTGNTTGMTLSFKSNNGNYSKPSVGYGEAYGSSATVTDNLGTSTVPIYGISFPSGTKTIKITFANTSGSNTRLDDFLLVAGAPVPNVSVTTGEATGTTSATGLTATLNGSITLVNGATWSDVTECGFKYKTGSDDYTTVTVAKPSSGTSANISKDISGLTKDEDYTYYAYALYKPGEDAAVEKKGENVEFTPTKSDVVEPTLQYTLDGTETGGTNGYAAESDIEQDEISWKAMGNTTTNPWRIGGKVDSGTGSVSRAIYSTEPIPATITSIDVASGIANVNSVNSLTITVHNSAADAASGSNAIASKTESTESNIKSKTVTLSGGSWTGKFYRIVYNVTVPTSNKYIEFNSAKFYGYDPE